MKILSILLTISVLNAHSQPAKPADEDHLEVRTYEAAPPGAPGSRARREVSIRRPYPRLFKGDGGPHQLKAEPALIIRTSTADPKSADELQEDLAVMSRVLRRALGEFNEGEERAMGITVLDLAGERPNASMYIEDYGAIFTFLVGTPLVPPAKADADPVSKPDESAAEWERAREDLFGRKRSPRAEERPARAYNPKEVARLEQSVIRALRHASNIRGLKSADYITIALRSRPPELTVWSDSLQVEAFQFEGDVVVGTRDPEPSGTLVIRVKKSDLDQAARDNLDAEAFRKLVTVQRGLRGSR